MSWHKCPTCSKPCFCVDTRWMKAYTRRRYACKGKPEHRFSTSEVLVPKGMMKQSAPVQRMARLQSKVVETEAKLRKVLHDLTELTW